MVLIFMIFSCACSSQKGALNAEAKRIAIDNTATLLQSIHDGSCSRIYDESSTEFQSQTRSDWLEDCGHLHEQLANFQSFAAQDVTTCDTKGMVCVEGTAAVKHATYEIMVGWTIQKNRPELIFLSLRGAGERYTTPFRPHIMMDTPRRGPARDLTSNGRGNGMS